MSSLNNPADVGVRSDNHTKDSIYGKLDTIGEHFHMRQRVYPTLANGVTLTTAIASWTLGNITEIIPSNTIERDFDIHFINTGIASEVDTYEIVLYRGLTGQELEIARTRTVRVSNQTGAIPIPITMEIQPANSRISAAIATSTATSDTLVISVSYHVY